MRLHVFLVIDENRYQSGKEMCLEVLRQGAVPHVVCRSLALNEELISLGVDSRLVALNSLSQARNILIRDCESEIRDEDLVVFCDDDGFWPPNFVERIDKVLSSGEMWALIPYSADLDEMTNKRFPSKRIILTPRKICDLASSLGLLMVGEALKGVGNFNENFGVGTLIPIGEDTDFALRLHREFGKGFYTPYVWQCHPVGNERSPERIAASIFFLYFQMRKFPILFISFAKSLRHIFSNRVVRKSVLSILRNLV
jgi:hypothetical protein